MSLDHTSEKRHLNTSTLSRKKFTTVEAAKRLMSSMEEAINNMIDEIKKPVDPEINGSARKAELQSIKQTATDCKELLVERQRLEHMIKDEVIGRTSYGNVTT